MYCGSVRVLVLSLTSLCVALQASDNKTTTLPSNYGPYSISTSVYTLTTNRTDPLASSPERRRLSLSIYQPLLNLNACPNPRSTSYMSPLLTTYWSDFFSATSEFNTRTFNTSYNIPTSWFSRVSVTDCPADPFSPASPLTRPAQENPLLIFSHGATITQLVYQALLSAVASTGYTIVTIDHTYDSGAVQFPGEDELVLNTWPALTFEEIDPRFFNNTLIRAADVSSVLDAVQEGSIPGLEHYAGPSLRAGAFGHSLGGATAAMAISQDSRLVGGINLDGTLWGSSPSFPIDVPFAYLSAAGTANQGPQINGTWAAHWDNVRAWKRWVSVLDAAHMSFSDIPLIGEGLGESDLLGEAALVGTIASERMLGLAVEGVKGLFDLVFKGGDGGLLKEASEKFGEVEFIRSEDGPQ